MSDLYTETADTGNGRPAYNVPVMRITFERTGGFAGRKVQARIDTNTLTPAQAEQLQRLLAESGFFRLPGRLDPAVPQADRFRYLLTIETGKRSHTVQASDEAVPPAMRPLLDWLSRFGRTPLK